MLTMFPMTKTSRRQLLLTSVPAAAAGYGVISLRAGHLLGYGWGIFALIVVLACGELWNRVSEFASLDPEGLCVSRRGNRGFRTQEIHIPYGAITRITTRRGQVEVAYRNPNAIKRVLGEYRESIRTDVPQEFVDALQQRIAAATGVTIPVQAGS